MGMHLISNGTVLDCTGKAARANTSVLVRDGKIAKIGRPQEVKAEADHRGKYLEIDAKGKTVMPGIIDAHCHISYGDVRSIEELDLYTGVEYRSIKAAYHARKVLRAGVTSICDPGSTWNISAAVRDAIAAGMVEGPRMVSAGRYISTFNAIGSPWPAWIDHPVSSFGVLANTKDEMVTEVRREVKLGVDIIKVAGDGDTTTTSNPVNVPTISFEELQAIAEETHRLQKRCTIHARSGAVAADAARAGFDWLIHASFLSDADLDVIVKRGTPICPTFSLLVNTVDWAPSAGPVSERILDAYKYELERACDGLTKARKAGIKLMAGTDTGQSAVPYGEWHAREMEHFVKYLGCSPMEALLAGTRDAAFAMGMEDKVGTLEEGKFADILVVNGDPLLDISVLQDKERLSVIMKNGEIVDTSTPIPERKVWGYELPMIYWNGTELPSQAWVREHVTKK